MANILSIISAAGYGALALDAINLFDRASRDASRLQTNLKFPSDLKNDVPYMSMQFSAYKRRSIYQQPFYQPEMKIRLPIPENLTERTSVTYGNANLDSVTGAALETASGALNGQGGQGENIARGAVGVLAGAGAVLGGTAASRLSSGTPDAVSALTGITTNPFQVVLFKSPNFRSHSFSWRFVPRSAIESEEIRKIVETFRYHSLPGISTAQGVLFSYPEILEIAFGPTDDYLYKFKPCVVEDISVNFAPSGPSFYRTTNAPTAVQFTIGVKEIEIWTKADWDRNSLRAGLGAGRLPIENTIGPTISQVFETVGQTLRDLDAPFRQDARAGTNQPALGQQPRQPGQ